MHPNDPRAVKPAALRMYASPRSMAPPVASPVPPLHARYRIMVVDDMSVSRGVLAQSLEMLDCQRVVVAGDGRSAMARLLESPADLVLCDYMMPGMTGLELLDRIRRSPDLALMRFVLVTGTQEPGLEREAASLGVSAILWKPFGLKDMRNLIDQVMRRSIPMLRARTTG